MVRLQGDPPRAPSGLVAAFIAGLLVVSPLGNARADEPESLSLGRMTLGYTYYNRPGATRAQHDADVRDCALAAGKMHSVTELYEAAPPSFSRYPFADKTDRNLGAASLENCMVVRGWRVVLLPDDEGKALSKLPFGTVADTIAPWIGTADPHGRVVRTWNNDAVFGSTIRYETTPPRTKRGQLSLIGGAPDLQELPTSPAQMPASPWINPRWPRKPLAVTDLAALRPDAAVVIVQVKGIGMLAGLGIAFNRIGPDPDARPSIADHATDMLFAGTGWLYAKRDGNVFVFAVPEGRWRLYGLGAAPTLNLCLGSPSFEVKAGEVVYAGSWDLGAANLGPDLDLAPAKAWLGAVPEAQRLRPAAFVNGSLGPCGDNTIYALEIKGASFEPGYAWGSQASLPPAR